MKTADFDYQISQELIAQKPAAKRDHSRLMIVDRKHQSIEHKHFYDIIDYLNPGDLLVLNDTKVMPANLVGRKVDSGAKIEVLLVKRDEKGLAGISREEQGKREEKWRCLVRPGKKLKVGSYIRFSAGLTGEVLEKLENGEQVIRFEGNLDRFMRKHGELPLPPYIKQTNSPPKVDFSLNGNHGFPPSLIKRGGIKGGELGRRYQTVYAEREGASAAPTAGLHFTKPLLNKIKKKGINIAHITLHTGPGTFQPVRTEFIRDHKMHTEYFEVSSATRQAVKKAKRVVAVGTTSVRALEAGGKKGETDLFITPGYNFKAVDALVTNFHWPRSTLIMLVSAFAGKELIFRAYREAMEKKYRFFSFGDAMLVI